MNKQEQIEKMSEILHKDLGIGTTAEITAKTLFLKGYINGADFVKWLKSRFDHWKGVAISIRIDDIEKLLQEYLKGE